MFHSHVNQIKSFNFLRKSLSGKKSASSEENPVRVVTAFAPSRSRNMTGLHPTTVYRFDLIIFYLVRHVLHCVFKLI